MSVKNRFSNLMREAGYYRFSRRNFLKSLVGFWGGLALFWKGPFASRKNRLEVDNSLLPRIPLKKFPDKIPGPDKRLLG